MASDREFVTFVCEQVRGAGEIDALPEPKAKAKKTLRPKTKSAGRKAIVKRRGRRI